MKYAITSETDSIAGKIDRFFARAPFFAVYNAVNDDLTFIPNPYLSMPERAGPAVANMLSSLGVERIVSGEFGEKVKITLDSLSIAMIILNPDIFSVSEVIEIIKSNKKK